MDYERESREAHVLQQTAREYASSLDMVLAWQSAKGSGAERFHAEALRRRERAYAALTKAALDLFQDGDLFDKWYTACQDAGIEVVS